MIVFFQQVPVYTCHQASFINLSWTIYNFPAFKLCHTSNSTFHIVVKNVGTQQNEQSSREVPTKLNNSNH